MYNHENKVQSATLHHMISVLGTSLKADNVTPEQANLLKQLAIAYSLPVTTSITNLVSLWNNGEGTTVTVDTTEAEQRLNDALHTRFHEYESGAKDRLSTSMSTINDRQVEWLKDMRNQLDVIKKKSNQARHLVVKTDTSEVSFEGELVHETFPDVLACIGADVQVWLVGGAGSGKTTLGSQVAKALALKFYTTSAVQQAFELQGYMDAHGKYVETDFYRAFKHGGLFLFDEIDASNPNALTSFNQAIANEHCPFPCGMITKHADFRVIASANTVGHGRTQQYVGRNQLDGATLDRFTQITMKYDENIERTVANNDAWVDEVRAVRQAVEAKGKRYIISPRASIQGARMLANGINIEFVRQSRLFAGMPPADIKELRVEATKILASK
tara:strand:- start:1001 stop:2161 length:1161 start_codon:yes stop_codon:yes gene_type:complete